MGMGVPLLEVPEISLELVKDGESKRGWIV